MSRAKSIQLVDGAVISWDLLLAQDIDAGNFEFNDFIEAMKEPLRKPMYNRIDYSDIYVLAKEIFAAKREQDVQGAAIRNVNSWSDQPKSKMPEAIKIQINKARP